MPTGGSFNPDRTCTIPKSCDGYWRLEEATGATRNDSYLSENLTDSGNVAQIAGIRGNAAHFVASSGQHLWRANDLTDLTGAVSFTVAAWIYMDSKPGLAGVAGKFESVIANREWNLSYRGGASDFFEFYISDGLGANNNVTGFTAPTTATWHFLVAWFDSQNAVMYLQGDNGTVASSGTTIVPNAIGVGRFRIGIRGDTNTEWDGRIDEFGFWKRVLTADERADLYNRGLGNTYDPNLSCGSWLSTVGVT